MIYSFLLAIAALGLSILISLPLGKWMFKVMCPKANLKPLHAKTESFFRRIIGKAADADQIFPDLALLKGKLLIIGKCLKLAAAAFTADRTFRYNAVW